MWIWPLSSGIAFRGVGFMVLSDRTVKEEIAARCIVIELDFQKERGA
jgi:hypothetical protein